MEAGIVSVPAGSVTELSEVQPWKVLPASEVTESGMTADSSASQPLKAWAPMEVTLSGIVISVRPVQPENA